MYGVLDVGTSRSKIFIYDREMTLRYREVLPNYTSPDGTQDPWHIVGVVRHFVKKAREFGVKTYGVATYRASVVAWKKDGSPATPIYTWLARSRGGGWLRYLKWMPKVGIIFSEISPIYRFIEAFRSCRDCFIWTLDSYVAYVLTKRFISDATNAALSGLIHPRTLRPIPLLAELARLKLTYPEVVDNYAELGETEGMEFRVLIADQQSASVAEGATRPERIKVTLGTGLFVDIPTDSYVAGVGVPVVLYKLGGQVKYGVEFHLPSVGVFIDSLVKLGVVDYGDLSSGDLGGEYIYILPTVAGIASPRLPWARGAIIGFTTATNKSSMAASIVSTLAFFTKYYIDKAPRKSRFVVVNGGGARFENYLRCLASLVDAEVITPLDYEGTARGVLALLLSEGSPARIESIWSYRRVEGGYLNCRTKYDLWRRQMSYLKNLRPFFQER